MQPDRPSGIAAAAQRRHDKESRALADAHSAAAATPVAQDPPKPAPDPPRVRQESVRVVVTTSASGAKLETFVGREPRADVETGPPPRGRAPVRIARFGRVHHLLGDMNDRN